MLRLAAGRLALPRTLAVATARSSHAVPKPEEFIKHYVDFLEAPDLDLWELRKGLNDCLVEDVVPPPEILIAGFKAARRLNDHSTPVRLIEALRDKSPDQATYDYVLDQVKPTMEELGISHPVELGLETAPK